MKPVIAITIMLLVCACGGGDRRENAGDTSEAVTGHWNEPSWHIAEYRGCLPSGDCNSIDYFLYPQFSMDAYGLDPSHTQLPIRQAN